MDQQKDDAKMLDGRLDKKRAETGTQILELETEMSRGREWVLTSLILDSCSRL